MQKGKGKDKLPLVETVAGTPGTAQGVQSATLRNYAGVRGHLTYWGARLISYINV